MIRFLIFQQVTLHFHFVMSLTNYTPSAPRQWTGHPYLSWSSQYFTDWTCPQAQTFYAWNCSLFGAKLSEETGLPSRSAQT